MKYNQYNCFYFRSEDLIGNWRFYRILFNNNEVLSFIYEKEDSVIKQLTERLNLINKGLSNKKIPAYITNTVVHSIKIDGKCIKLWCAIDSEFSSKYFKVE